MPNDGEFLKDGGYAIYIRHKTSEQLLQRYVSVSAVAEFEAIVNDFTRLKTIDEIPSLDPFLLKTTF